MQVSCAAGHPLVPTHNPYPGKAWTCDVCKQGGHKLSYHCNACSFDSCEECARRSSQGHGGHHQQPHQQQQQYQQQQYQQPQQQQQQQGRRHEQSSHRDAHGRERTLHHAEDYSHLRHDHAQLGGHRYTQHTGLYGAKTGGGGTHQPIPASAIANQFQSYHPEIQRRAAEKAQAMNMETGRGLAVSDLTGKKRALLIGCNYPGTPNQLKGCVNDVTHMKQFIVQNFGFPEDNIRVLTDYDCTRGKIIACIEWLVQGASSGDSLFFHYSGHGATQPDQGPVFDEPTGMDETLVPFDYQQNGMLSDDDLHDMLVAKLPPGARLTAITDCCHSGSVLDLPYSYLPDTTGRGLEPTEIDNRQVLIAHALAAGKAMMAHDSKAAMAELLQAGQSFFQLHQQHAAAGGGGGGGGGGHHGLFGGLLGELAQIALGGQGQQQQQQQSDYQQPQQQSDYQQPQQQQQQQQGGQSSGAPYGVAVKPEAIQIRTSLADVVHFSGCKDDQTSADAFIGGESQGALTWAFIEAHRQGGNGQSFAQLLEAIRALMQGKYKQIPMLNTGMQSSDLRLPFNV
jgi:hypothetical protein